ncbi:hypothetical protein [Caulobacter sp. 17J80-11]|uniref:hypothetical protein n=1 Tax=Caulobacter sp. 17J80-11 TaxID=2763502 RepID=UPI0016537F26|nr:hypothetical protein [Caulobacter sp. 17J80-11]MBC6982910.1 hypothetical protein [Caulobacter sp. 17J80-11]
MNRKANLALTASLALATIAGVIMAVQHARAATGFVDLGLALVAAGIAGLSLKYCVQWWRTVDEAAREAHKFAWYWGGSIGLGLAGGVAIVLQRTPAIPLRDLAPLSGDAGLFATGVLACIVCQTVGYGVAWAGWWLARR